jgi:hypothetical protein
VDDGVWQDFCFNFFGESQNVGREKCQADTCVGGSHMGIGLLSKSGLFWPPPTTGGERIGVWREERENGEKVTDRRQVFIKLGQCE